MMKAKLTKLDIMTAILTLCSVIPGLAVYSRLPDKIATHFSVTGSPDQYSSKGFAVLGIPIFMTVAHIVCCLITSSDKRTENSPKVNKLLRFFVPVLAFTVETVIILYSLGRLKDITMIMVCLVSILMIVLGNYMPKTRQNSFIGIKTPKTLSDEAAWDKTHRLAGIVWVIAGVAMLTLGLLSLYIPAMIVFAAAILIPAIYQFVI